MKKMMGTFFLGILFSTTSFATTYYVDGSIGSDSYNGTSLTHPSGTIGPWKNLARIESANLQAGDTVYIRGGIYNSTRNAAAGIHLILQDLNGTSGSPITISAYNGEKPIFDMLSVGAPTVLYPFGVVVLNSQYVHLKGLTIRNLKQVSSGLGISRGFQLENSDNCTIELLNVYNIGGAGIGLANSNNNLILNNDSHHNGDGLGDPANPTYGIWNTGDGIDIGTGGDTSTGNTFEGNRTYLNCDDGFDAFDWNGTKVTYKNNWSFWNGVKPWKNSTTLDPSNMTPETYSSVAAYAVNGGNGEGFKLGGHNSAVANYPDPNSLRKFLSNNLAFENTGGGFQQNMDAPYAHQMQLVNNTAYGNNNDGFGFGVGRSSNPSIAHIFKNNLSFDNNRVDSGGDFVFDGLAINVANNYWGTSYQFNYGNLHPPLMIDLANPNDDFLTLDSAGVTGPRQADGSLPNLNFLKLASGSDLMNKGTPINNLNGVTISYNGTAPDLGAYEYIPAGATDTTAPIVVFTAPTALSTVSGTTILSASASDNSGVVTKVEFYDGATLISTDSASPFMFDWDTTTVAEGIHTLSVKAYDASSNVGLDSITVTVSNTDLGNKPTTDPQINGTSTVKSGMCQSNGASSLLFILLPLMLAVGQRRKIRIN